jgi:endonuclease YncB( thermonuclease family)
VPLTRFSLLALFLFFLGKAHADVADAPVTHVGDGDSLSVCIGGREARVRLVGIDAPEYRQAFGREARRSLAGLCEGRVARLEWTRADRYGRMLARVSCGGKDANAEQVRRGMAWVSDLDAPQPELQAQQQAARAARRGLWSELDAVPPWQWRRDDRRERKPERTGPWPGADGRPC